jgi:hypothetical protein
MDDFADAIVKISRRALAPGFRTLGLASGEFHLPLEPDASAFRLMVAGGKRSATTGCVAPISLHPEGMPAVNPRVSGHMQHPLDSTAR